MADPLERLARLERAVLLLIELNELDVIAQIPMAIQDKMAGTAAELLSLAAQLKLDITGP